MHYYYYLQQYQRQQYQNYFNQLNFSAYHAHQASHFPNVQITIPENYEAFPPIIKIEDSPPLSLQKPSFTVKIEEEDGLKKRETCSTTTLPGNNLDDAESDDERHEDEASVSEEEEDDHLSSRDNHLEAKINAMLKNFVEHFSPHESQDFQPQREKYAQDPVLAILFDQLIAKFSASSKCREDMIRVVMRKATQFLQKTFQEPGVKTKDLPRIFCQKYFTKEYEELDDVEDKKTVQTMINNILPYKRGSANKTVNSDSINKLFASEKFANDYEKMFLAQFTKIMDKDNQVKFKKFKEYLVKCAQEKNPEVLKKNKLQGFKRIPWLQEWIVSAQDLAHELNDPASNRRIKRPIYKKLKTGKA